jgi:hypothetical protein
MHDAQRTFVFRNDEGRAARLRNPLHGGAHVFGKRCTDEGFDGF